jgi:zinc transport system substrate-binding protein
VVAVAALASACGGGDGATDSRLTVVASFYPLAEAARRVGGDRVRVTNLTPAGAEPHDLELSPDQVDRIEDARIVVYLGGGFQPAVEQVVGRASGTLLDVLSRNIGQEGEDPHVWLDPVSMKQIVEEIRATYAQTDPGPAAQYQAGADAYSRELDDLDRRFREGLRDCARRDIVTSHAAFGYLARQYGLRQHPVAGLSPESEPAPGRISELAAEVRQLGVTTVFYESLVSPRVAEALAREANVRTAVLNPLEGLTEEELDAGKNYISVMGENLAALRAALGCP